MKYCSRCNTHKPFDDFGKNKVKKDGLAVYCKPCYRNIANKFHSENPENTRARAAKNRVRIKEWFTEYRSGLSCEDCGQNHPATLDFHHIDPTEKDDSVTQMVHDCFSIDNIKLEIAKCKVLCSNCHRILHWNERNGDLL